MLQQCSSCTEVTLQKDGSWVPLIPKKETPKEQITERKKSEVAVETLSDDSSDEDDKDGEGKLIYLLYNDINFITEF